MTFTEKRRERMGNYNIGEVWWTQFPFEDTDEDKHRPAIVTETKKRTIVEMDIPIKLCIPVMEIWM